VTPQDQRDPAHARHDDLRSGRSPWDSRGRPKRAEIDHDVRCDVLVVGAGITGSMVAEHLTSLGRSVVVIDREKSGVGSTVASTAMLQWEIDRSLAELTEFYGFEAAAHVYRKSFRAVQALRDHVTTLNLACAFRPRPSLLLADGEGGGEEGGEKTLRTEASLRERAGLPTRFLDHAALLAAYGVAREAALESMGSAEADPVCLAHGLLAVALQRGARLYDGEAVAFESVVSGVAVALREGPVIEARHVVLATGYVMPDIVPADLHIPSSSWAVATVPQSPEALWPQGALIWEDATPYAYLRTTMDHRIIIGGEDERGLVDSDEREALTPSKIERLQHKLGTLFPGVDRTVDYAWSGAFGETQDGLPLIGPVPGHPSVYAAYGYGGNGITFSFLAAHMLARLMSGRHERWDERFALDRPPNPVA
jgi:glycine/D-amino acid oxidase-like deaminating enzyme